jgi:hypothetical protein
MTTKISCSISTSSESDRTCTIDWLNSSGAGDEKTLDKWNGKNGEVEIEFQLLPTVLARLSLIEPNFMLTRISPLGVVLYLCDLGFQDMKNPFGRTAITAKCGDGCIFIPMSNIICINFFVGLSPG